MLLKLSDQLRDLTQGGDIFDHILNLEGQIFRSQKNRRTVRVSIHGRGYFIKTHRGTAWKEIFKNLFQLKLPVLSSRNEVRAISRLEELGIATVKMAGFGIRGIPPAWLDSFIITEELENAVSLEIFCQDWPTRPPDFSLKSAIILKVAEIARRLHTNGVNHRDFYLCHFFIDLSSLASVRDYRAVVLYLIDLHRVQVRERTPGRYIRKDLQGLFFSVTQIGLTSRDVFRFMKAYRGKPLRDTLREDRHFWTRILSGAERLDRKHGGPSGGHPDAGEHLIRKFSSKRDTHLRPCRRHGGAKGV